MKIVNISYRYFPERDHMAWISGFGFYYTIWEELARKHEVICVEHIDHSGTYEYKGIRYLFEKMRGLALLLPFRLHHQLCRLQADVAVVHSLLSPVQLILLRSALGASVRIVVQHHAEKPPRRFLKRQLQRWADRRTDLYFFSGDGLAQPWIEQGLVAAGKVREVMEVTSVFGPGDRAVARRITQVSGEKTYIWVGHLNENKNPLLALRAFMAFLSEGNTAAVYMIFQTEQLLPEIKEYLEQYPQLAAHIHLVGKVPHAELQHWFNSVDFIISSSAYEGSGVAVCEAMSCGCIPVLSAIPSFRFMSGGSCGFLYEPGDEMALLAALKESAGADLHAEREKTLLRYAQRLSAAGIASDIEAAVSVS
ncbi:MAG: glycosyltransferase family 4 protein [Chitinophagaceae bacterium]|nr:glycosyltransferase family 4 protein [Chitinophagaceae bacterium]